MKIPDKLNLHGVTYDVVWRDELFDDDNNRLHGRINFQNNIIELNRNSQSYQSACRTLLHELCHYMIDEFHIDENMCQIPTSEEAVCEMFSRAFYQILEDNQLQ